MRQPRAIASQRRVFGFKEKSPFHSLDVIVPDDFRQARVKIREALHIRCVHIAIEVHRSEAQRQINLYFSAQTLKRIEAVDQGAVPVHAAFGNITVQIPNRVAQR